MSSRTLYRLSGVALLTGGLIMAIGLVGALFVIGGSPGGSPSTNSSVLFQLVFLVIMCGLVLIVAGLPGMYLRQARRTRLVGFIGFVLTLFGVLLDLGLALFVAIIVPWISTAAPQLLTGGPAALFILLYSPFLLLCVGSLVLAIAALQAGVLPSGVIVVLILSGIANLISIADWPISLAGFIGQFLFAGGLAWVGYILVSRQVEEVVDSSLLSTDVPTAKVSS
jgi:hypothetical protein